MKKEQKKQIEVKEEEPEKSKILSFFLIGFPTVIIILLPFLTETSVWAQILIAIYQFIVLKKFLDKYYEVF